MAFVSGGLARNRTGVTGFAVRCVATPPRGRTRISVSSARPWGHDDDQSVALLLIPARRARVFARTSPSKVIGQGHETSLRGVPLGKKIPASHGVKAAHFQARPLRKWASCTRFDLVEGRTTGCGPPPPRVNPTTPSILPGKKCVRRAQGKAPVLPCAVLPSVALPCVGSACIRSGEP